MIVLHGLKACDTCRKALKALTAKGIDVRLRDLRDRSRHGSRRCRAWHAQFGGALLNTRSTTWRGLTDAERAGDSGRPDDRASGPDQAPGDRDGRGRLSSRLDAETTRTALGLSD